MNEIEFCEIDAFGSSSKQHMRTRSPKTSGNVSGTRPVVDREYKSREVAQSPIYVIVHSVLGLSFCTQPFPTPSGGLWSL